MARRKRPTRSKIERNVRDGLGSATETWAKVATPAQIRTLGKLYSNELALFKLAQKIVDRHMGKGAYVRMNHFDPSKGQTHA